MFDINKLKPIVSNTSYPFMEEYFQAELEKSYEILRHAEDLKVVYRMQGKIDVLEILLKLKEYLKGNDRAKMAIDTNK